MLSGPSDISSRCHIPEAVASVLVAACLFAWVPPQAARAAEPPPHAHHAAGHKPAAAAPKAPAKPAPEPAAAPAATPDKPQAKPAEAAKAGTPALPLPRFAALRSDSVYMRKGPGMRYPIEWVYKRADLPVEILREFDVWRLVRDPDGNKGWMHQATLTGRRAVMVQGEQQTLRAGADDSAPAVAKLKPGVIGRLRGCEADAAWCRVQVGDYRGWLPRAHLWGIESGEAVQ